MSILNHSTVAPRSEPTTRGRAKMARQDAEQLRDQSRHMDRAGTENSVGVSPVAATALIGGGVVGLALMSEAMDVEQEQIDAEYLAGEEGLAQEWSADMEDPSVAGVAMVTTEAAGPAQTVEQEVDHL